MKREFLINIVLLVLINILVKPVYILFIETRVQDTLGPNVYGLYFAIFNLAYMLQILSDLGIQNYNSRTIANQPALLTKMLPDILGVKLILGAVYLMVAFTLAAAFGYLSHSALIFGLVALNLVLLSFILYLRTNIAATGHYRIDSLVSVADKFLLILILAWMLFVPENAKSFSIYSFLLAQTISLVLVLILAGIINVYLAGFLRIRFSRTFAKKLLRESFPFSLVIILMSLYMRMDGFMLERLLDDDAYQAGVYAAAFRIYEAFNMIGYLFAVLLLPMFASLLAQKTELLALIKSSHNLMLALSGSLVLGGLLFRQQIMFFLYPTHADPYYGELLGLLLLSFFAISLSYIYGTYLTSAKKLGPLNRLLLAGVLINLVFNLLLIPDMGARGAAYTTVFTQFFVLAGQYLLSFRELRPAIEQRLLIRRTGFILGGIGLFLAFQKYITNDNWIPALIFFEAIMALLALALGLLGWKDWIKKSA